MFHTPAHKCDPRFPVAGTFENVPYANDPRVIVDREPVVDVTIADHGSVVIVTPVSAEACAWCERYIAHAMRWAGGYAVEQRYIDGLVGNMLFDGLEVA